MRVCAFSLRDNIRGVFRCAGFEFEDAIVDDLEDGFLVQPPKAELPDFDIRVRRWMAMRGLTDGSPVMPARTKPMGQDCDLFFVNAALLSDLWYVDMITDWRKRSGKAVCFLQELWRNEIDAKLPSYVPILNRFDHVFCTLQHSVERMNEILDVPVSYMPWGVDAAEMSPYHQAAPKERVVDMTVLGWVRPAVHDALWNWAENSGRYYNFTTTGLAAITVHHKVHRRALTNQLQRSKFFLTYMAKRETMFEIHGQAEFGPRYFEGAASGAVMLGDPLTGQEAFDAYLGWEDAVIDAPADGPDIPTLIEALEQDPDRLERIRRTNVAQCLRRHDNAHRWQHIAQTMGLTPSAATQARIATLDRMADEVEAGA